LNGHIPGFHFGLICDLAAVEEMELVERKPEGVRARRELILAFLPWRRTTAQQKAGT
jgi:hypothetical protein